MNKKKIQILEHIKQHNFWYGCAIRYRQILLSYYFCKTLQWFSITHLKHIKAFSFLYFLYVFPGKSTFQSFIAQFFPIYIHSPATLHQFPSHHLQMLTISIFPYWSSLSGISPYLHQQMCWSFIVQTQIIIFFWTLKTREGLASLTRLVTF